MLKKVSRGSTINITQCILLYCSILQLIVTLTSKVLQFPCVLFLHPVRAIIFRSLWVNSKMIHFKTGFNLKQRLFDKQLLVTAITFILYHLYIFRFLLMLNDTLNYTVSINAYCFLLKLYHLIFTIEIGTFGHKINFN